MNTAPALAPDAAMVLGIASTATPFANTREAEAECWLRILRLYGEAGVVLQALGVGESRIQPVADDRDRRPAHGRAEDRDLIALIADEALQIASERGAAGIGTADVLLAVMRVYGADFDRVLQAHGTDCDEVTRRLGVELPCR